MFCFFGHEARGILAPQPGIKLAPPVLEGEVLTTGLPGSPGMHILSLSFPFSFFPVASKSQKWCHSNFFFLYI